MFISKIHIQNYRNFNDFSMEFHKGLNVIVGANNSGKTGLLNAINLLNEPKISIHDFNKNNLKNHLKLYTEEAPKITVEYTISHTIREDDDQDESILKLLPFLGLEELSEVRKVENGTVEYHISALVKAVFSLDAKETENYRESVRKEVHDYDSYLLVLERFVDNKYLWTYTNGMTDTKVEPRLATSIFDIRYIKADRTSDDVSKETRQKISSFLKEQSSTAEYTSSLQSITKIIQGFLKPSIDELGNVFNREGNDIGLSNGNVSINSTVEPHFSYADSYVTTIKDTKGDFTLPLDNNGLGYNNLINIYMLIRLSEIHPGRDFRILCLEEPEAHLHPAMQYKLFKFLKKLDEEEGLNQQLFVTTHSSNISAVAGLDNMYMMAYDRDKEIPDCVQQSLEQQFFSTTQEKEKSDAKNHLTKFLDVTRSDMLFADKIILVEGIAEKLLMPLFMDICNCPYEDKHISIVEIGGKHFKYFIELFNNNAVKKKVLCITDKDYPWISSDGSEKGTLSGYGLCIPDHIKLLNKQFPINNLKICTQTEGGRTFEDELFISNMADLDVAKTIFKKAVNDKVFSFAEKYGFDVNEWKDNISILDGRVRPLVEKYLSAFDGNADWEMNRDFYGKLVFAEIFLHYAENKKGDVALDILTEPSFITTEGNSKLVVPSYIKEGLEWLMK